MMRETIIFHELGHQTMNYAVFSPEQTGLSQSPSYYGTDDIFDALNEFFADFCPFDKGI